MSGAFQDLIVWQKAMQLVRLSYEVAGKLPRYELYGLGDQIRRSAISIPSNIAEGSKRNGRKEFNQFCGIARGSAAELETQLLAVAMLHAEIDAEPALKLLNEIQKMLTNLSRKLQSEPL